MYLFLRQLGFLEEIAQTICEKLLKKEGYHGIFHIKRLWDKFEIEKSSYSEEEQTILGLTIIYHDIVYVPGREDNEIKSIQCLLNDLEVCNIELPATILFEIIQCILLSNPLKYDNVIEDVKSLQYKFVVDYDLDHLINPNETLDEACRLITIEAYSAGYSTETISRKSIRIMQEIQGHFPQAKNGCELVINYFGKNIKQIDKVAELLEEKEDGPKGKRKFTH